MFSRRPDFLTLISNPNGTSRIKLSRATAKSPAKIGQMVHQLLNLGILEEKEAVATSRGRRPIMLKPSRDLGYLMGIDVGLINLRVMVTDMQGNVLQSTKTASHARAELAQALPHILSTADGTLTDASIPRNKLLAVGVSHSGGINADTGECLYWHRASQWKGLQLRKIFSEHYGVPCQVDDAAHNMAIAEKVYGAAQHTDTFVLISVGQGIGAGLFVDGQLFRGNVGIAGEVGHTTILPGGPRCSCGNRGCLEIMASGHFIMDAAAQALSDNVTTSLCQIVANEPGGVTVEAVCQAARSGDRLARRIIDQAATYIGLAVANLINLFNPPLIIFGGAVVEAAQDLLLEPVIREASASAFEEAYAKTRIVRSTLGNLSAARGATLSVASAALRRVWGDVLAASGESSAFPSTAPTA